MALQRTPARGHPRRAPTPEQRQVDAERSKAALVDAALEEFAAKGFAGARVRDIAERAGVSKDLIVYHFGGKEGLYDEVTRAWLTRRDTFVDRDLPLEENVARYLHDMLADPRPLRLLAWRGLAQDTGSVPGVTTEAFPSVADLVVRQERGELKPTIDPATLQLMLIAAIAAPILFPDNVRHLFGTSTADPGFEARYRAGLTAVLRALGATADPQPNAQDAGAGSAP
jgi:AcrR family transcriptional regulator